VTRTVRTTPSAYDQTMPDLPSFDELPEIPGLGEYRQLDHQGRVSYAESPTFAGLAADEAMARYVWNAHPAAVVCDNPAVEVVPTDPAVGSLHRRLIPLLGMALGEMFDFETLAQRCRT
jgi:hypothetical protein